MRKLVPLAIVAIVLVTVGVFEVTFQRHSPPPAVKSVHVSIVPGASSYVTGYDPDNITVVIGVNNTVVWTNNDNEPHTVTASDGSFDSGNMNPGGTFTYTFTRPGTYSYICTYHPWMRGFVTVVSQS
ncbi:MAG TPA: cupredoxin domain-containing protein [archaeon]|nr:cupredoxin domain-containing protein [archaeon]